MQHTTPTPEISVTIVTLRRACDTPYMGQKRQWGSAPQFTSLPL